MIRAVFTSRLSVLFWAVAMTSMPLLSAVALAQKFEVTPVAEKKLTQLPPGCLQNKIISLFVCPPKPPRFRLQRRS